MCLCLYAVYGGHLARGQVIGDPLHLLCMFGYIFLQDPGPLKSSEKKNCYI